MGWINKKEAKMNITLPEKIHMSTNLDGILSKIKQLENEEVILSFENINFVLPETTIILLAISKQIYDITKSKVHWSNIKEDILDYFDRIKLEKISFIELPRRRRFVVRKKEDYLVEMKIMTEPKQVDEMIAATKRILFQCFPERRADEYVKQISEYIRHIAGNSLEHSESRGNGVCYYTLQIYNPENKKATVHVAFGDTGMGIAQSLDKEYPWIAQKGKKAVEMAFVQGLSCRGQGNGGLGFRTVRSHLKKHGGEIMIRSGHEMLRYYGNSERYTVKKSKNAMVGTQTLILLK